MKQRAKRFLNIAYLSVTVGVMTGCGSGGSSDNTNPTTQPQLDPVTVFGKAIIGQVAFGNVIAYALTTDGSNGDVLGTTQTDNTGAFTITLSSAPMGGMRLFVSGGSYVSPANTAKTIPGASLSAIVSSVSNSAVVITPLTTFADTLSVNRLASTGSLPAALSQADGIVKTIYGIKDGGALSGLTPDFTAVRGDGSVFALVLGVLEQLAIINGKTPSEVINAIREDIADGLLDGKTIGGGAIHYDSATAAPATLSGTQFLSAMYQYVAPGNTATIIAQNNVKLDPLTVAALQSSVIDNGGGIGIRMGNNGALLSGEVIGEGTDAVSTLRKQIAVTVLGTNTSFTVGTAYATRSSTRNSGDYAYIILPVTNIGTQTLCFVKLAGITYRDASGTAIGVPGIDFVDGSVGKLASGIFTGTCLAPGEMGMVGDIEANLYTKVATMEFTFESGSSAISVPTASVIPQSYTTTSSLPAINVKNIGTGPAKFGLATVFLLDVAEQPLMWSLATVPGVPSVVVPASGTATMSSGLFYDGSGSKLLAFVDFEDAAAASLKQTFGIALPASEVCSALLPADEFKLCMNEIRNQRLEDLKSTYDAQLSTP